MTTITSDTPDPSTVGQEVTVNYTVAAVAPESGTPTGQVIVGDGVDSCTASVAAGGCTLTLTTAGARTLKATYLGNLALQSSTSAGGGAHRQLGWPPRARSPPLIRTRRSSASR